MAAGPRTPPNVSPMTQPFWDAAADHVLVRPVCRSCGRSFFSPRLACPACLSEDWSYEPSSGRGTVHSFTVVHRAPREGFEVPYVVADVDVEEGWNLMTTIVGCPPAAVRIGQAVVVSWLEVEPGTVLPAFSPSASPDAAVSP